MNKTILAAIAAIVTLIPLADSAQAQHSRRYRGESSYSATTGRTVITSRFRRDADGLRSVTVIESGPGGYSQPAIQTVGASDVWENNCGTGGGFMVLNPDPGAALCVGAR